MRKFIGVDGVIAYLFGEYVWWFRQASAAKECRTICDAGHFRGQKGGIPTPQHIFAMSVVSVYNVCLH